MPGKPMQFEILGKEIRTKKSRTGGFKSTCLVTIRADGKVLEKQYGGAMDDDQSTAMSNAANRAVKGAEHYRDHGKWG